VLAKRLAPLAHRFVRHEYTTPEPQCFDVAVAEAAAAGQPDTMADDFDREAVMLMAVSGGWCVHAARISHRKKLNKLTMPP
jgi:hypothetical protein